mmetsp:Transcript_49996/g.108697  ORF Transcript_49996/g.108697 Transcript_49996/m.108697 type:complete len:241 (-) Transcript_49996:293-1015(-)
MIVTSCRSALANLVHVDVSICGSGKERVSVGAPGQRHAPGNAVLRRRCRGELVQDILVLQIPDLDRGVCGCYEPVVPWAEDERIDGASCIKGVEVLSVVHIPEHSSAILASRGTQRAIRRDSGGVDHASVPDQVRAELAVAQVPDLHELVPASRDDQWHLCRWREADTADPIRVHGLCDGVLTLCQRVPQLDRLVSAARDDLAVVAREGDTIDVLGVPLEGAYSCTRVQVPEAHRLVPRA